MSTAKQRADTASSSDLLAVAEGMLPEIRAAADSIDEARRVPGWLADRLARAGFFHLLTGPEHGGLGADPVTAARVIETLSTASPSVGWVTMIIATASFWTVRVVPDEVRRRDLRRRSAGPDPAHRDRGYPGAPRAGLYKVEGGWRLSRPKALRQRLPPRHLAAHRCVAPRR